jgi:hypothetical protein
MIEYKTFTISNYKQYVLRLFGVGIWATCTSKDAGWIRILGKGISWKDTTTQEPLFSERNGYRKNIRIGKWLLTWLP